MKARHRRVRLHTCTLSRRPDLLRQLLVIQRKTGQHSTGDFHDFLCAYAGYLMSEHIAFVSSRPGYVRRMMPGFNPDDYKYTPKPFVYVKMPRALTKALDRDFNIDCVKAAFAPV